MKKYRRSSEGDQRALKSRPVSQDFSSSDEDTDCEENCNSEEHGLSSRAKTFRDIEPLVNLSLREILARIRHASEVRSASDNDRICGNKDCIDDKNQVVSPVPPGCE